MMMSKKLYGAAALTILLALSAASARAQKPGKVSANGLSFAYVEEGSGPPVRTENYILAMKNPSSDDGFFIAKM
jgi:hypothetical protein